jgi:hypothetical protein
VLCEPGMQESSGGVLHRLGSQFCAGRPKQGQQFDWQAPDGLVILPHWLSFRLPGGSRLGNGLIGTGFILAPDLYSQPFSRQVRSLNHRFFSGAEGAERSSTVPAVRLRTVVPVVPQVRLCCQLSPASCNAGTMGKVLTAGKPSEASRRARCSVESDQVAVLAS